MKRILTILCVLAAFSGFGQLVYEDFDTDDAAWIASSESGGSYWSWGVPGGTSIGDDFSGSGSAWVTGINGTLSLTDSPDLAYVTSPAYDLSSLTSEGSISVALNLDLVNDDWAYLEYSVDDGLSWEKLGNSGSGENWYDATDEVWNTTINTLGGWIVATQDLPLDVLGASSVMFRFVFDSIEPTGTYSGEGFAIDEFQILDTNTGAGGGGSGGPLPYEDFDLSDAGWVESSNSGSSYWEWGAPFRTQIDDDITGGGNAWVTGLNNDISLAQSPEIIFLTSPAYDLSALSATGSVSLAINYDLGTFNDGFDDVNDIVFLEYSLDGIDYTLLGEGGTGNNWYDEIDWAWVGNSGGWLNASHDLPAEILGQSEVYFRLVFYTNASIGAYGYEGFAMDEFEISENSVGGGGSGSGSGPGTTQILTMSLAGEIFPAVIDSTSNSVKLFVGPGTDVTALVPTLAVTDGATVDPISGSTQDFSSPVTYTVTASGGTESTDWEVSAVVPNINLSLYPKSGVAGTSMAIYGRGFSTTPAENLVTFGGTTVNVTSASTNKLVIEVPADAQFGLNEVLTSTKGISSNSGTYFNVLASDVSWVWDEYREADFSLNASSVVTSMDIGDLDNDGDYDLVYDNETILNIATLENGVIQSTVLKISNRGNGIDSFDDITIADVDGDGLQDIVAGGSRLGWFKNNGNGTWADELVIDDFYSTYYIRVFDFDGDFDFDILIDDGSNLYSFTNDGSGNFAENYKTVPFQLGHVIDWDEDGDMDLISATGSGNQIALSANDGSGNFTDQILHTTTVTDVDYVQLGDLDNDGDHDFVYATYDQGLSVSTVGYILNNGNGSFSPETTIATEGGFYTYRIELGDLNNDGFLDIARTKYTSSPGVFQVYITDGSLNYATIETPDGDAGGLDLALFDVDQDGDMDILQEASQSGGYFPLFIQLFQNAEISSFSLAEQTGTATINSTNATIAIEVTDVADVTTLVPTFKISPGAIVSPSSAVAQDFSNPVVYTVEPEDVLASTKNWTVTVHQIPSASVLSVDETSVEQTTADLDWTVTNNGASSFEIEVSESADFSSLVTGFDPLVIGSSASRSTSLTGLSEGVTHYVRIRGVNDLGTYSSYSNETSFLTKPANPVATVATNVVTLSFTANWDVVVGAAEYTIEVTDDDFVSTVFNATTTDTSIEVTGLSSGTTYKYRVTASNGTGSSLVSNEITTKTNRIPSEPRFVVGGTNKSVEENQPAGTVIGTLIAEDDDTEHTFSFATGTGDTDNDVFAIDGNNLVTTSVLSHEIKANFSVLVTATDPIGEVSAPNILNITVLDVNDIPSNISLELIDGGPTGYDPIETEVGILSTADEDVGDTDSNIKLELLEGADSFEIVRRTNANNDSTLLRTVVAFTNEEDLIIPILVRATDLGGATFEKSINVTINAFIDTEKPVIEIAAGTSNTYLSGTESKTISATVIDFRMGEMKFYSKLLTEVEWSSEIIPEVNGVYSKVIEEADLGVAGFEYYFEATDAAGNVGFSSTQTLALAFEQSGANAPKVESVTKFGNTVDSYQIISIPFDFLDAASKQVSAIFDEYDKDDYGTEYRIIKWNPTKDGVGGLDDLEKFNTIELGTGYFFISVNERAITIDKANINLTDPFPIELKQGWNLIGNPYTIDLSWTSVLTNNGAEAIVGPLRVLDTESSEIWPESDILKTLEGAFVFASEDITLNVSYTDASITFGGGRLAKKLSADWFLPITLLQGDLARKGGIGMDNRAETSFDQYDEPILPRWFKFLEMSFTQDEEKFKGFNKDVVPTSDSYIWEFEVSASQDGTSFFEWDEESSQVANLQLYNVATGEIIDMTKHSSYQFNLTGTVSFKILYSTDPNETFEFEVLDVLNAYPNPFTESFGVPLRLPNVGSAYEVRLDLLDLSGKLVHTGETKHLMSGSFEYIYKKPETLQPGVYLYRVVIDNQNISNSYTNRIVLR